MNHMNPHLPQDEEKLPISSSAQETVPLLERIRNTFEKIRTAIDQLFLPKGLTPELEKQILKKFQEKLEVQRSTYGFIPRNHYRMTADICMREAMHELLPADIDRRAIHHYLLGKVKK